MWRERGGVDGRITDEVDERGDGAWVDCAPWWRCSDTTAHATSTLVVLKSPDYT